MKRLAACVSLWMALLVVGLAPATAAPFSSLYVFGDSLSDVGNVFIATGGLAPAPPYFNGRSSNGSIWVDDLAGAFGLGPLRPSLAGGTDYAFGGAVTGPAVPVLVPYPFPVPDITQQVASFTANTGGVAPANALYVVWIGANDIVNALDNLAAGTFTATQAAAAVGNAALTAARALQTLAGEGARTFLVPLIPDLGVVPEATDVPALIGPARALSQIYNQALVTAIQTMTAGEGLTVDYLNTFALTDAAVANPAAFGLTNVTDRCYVGSLLGGGTVCATPGSYLFWDGEHPTSTTHALIAEAAIAAVPEPATALILVAPLLLAFRRRRAA